ncbi:hypothetical protein AB0H76_15155 [Nocardia sp. NPDC050712]|uniref:hypothetical protein n=1 Tax=Nocardia sp. NPDC050712 TaxID=3155518 RepID=UPI0034116C1D
MPDRLSDEQLAALTAYVHTDEAGDYVQPWLRSMAVELIASRARIAALEGAQKPGAAMPLSVFRDWLESGSRGLSSNAIVRALTGHSALPGKRVFAGTDAPGDAGDFWRCEELLRAVPEAREHLAVMAHVSPEWAALVPAWDELVALEHRPLTRRIWDLIEPRQQAARDGEGHIRLHGGRGVLVARNTDTRADVQGWRDRATEPRFAAQYDAALALFDQEAGHA